MADLKAEFKEAWILSNDDSSGPLAKVPRLLSDIAMDMLKAKMTYWEHYGWIQSCMYGLSGVVLYAEDSTMDEVKAYAQWLLESAPDGVPELYPRLKQYADGDLGEQEGLRQFVRKTQPEWLDRLAKNRASRAEAGVA